MSELYISDMTLRESRPRSKRLRGLGFRNMSFSGTQQGMVSDGLWKDLFEKVTVGTDGDGNPIYAIHAKYALYSDHNISAGGPGTSEGGGGSTVEWDQIVTTGTKIATITIDGVSQDVYAPNGGGTLAALSDVSLNDPSGYNVLYYNNSAWRNIPFSTLVSQWGLLSSSSEAMISGDWYFTENNPLKFVNNLGYIQIYGRRSGSQYSLNIYADYAINLMTGAGGKIYANGVEITGGGGGSTVSWGAESGGGVPLTVNGTAKTLALKSALSSYLPLAGGTMTGSILPNTTGVNLGSSAKVWGKIYANRWYPNVNDDTHFIEYTTNGFIVHGNIAADGQVAAGT